MKREQKMKLHAEATTWRTVIGKGQAFVVGLPSDFNLIVALQNAGTVQLATAFAHRSGWQHFRKGISEGHALVALLTGLEFFQTEPELLREWLDLKSKEAIRIDAKLASDKRFFHPKVLIVTGGSQRPDFAIVGSGNLSQGGLDNNTECGVYVEDPDSIKELQMWFATQFGSATPLTAEVIKKYEPSYKKNRERRQKLEKEQHRIAREVTSLGDAVMTSWNEAVRQAVKYFQGKQFARDYQGRRDGAARILKALKAPDFAFDKNGWNEFYHVGSLGQLDYRQRDGALRQKVRLQKALRRLIAGGKNVLPLVLDHDGSLHVNGLGLNTFSKILAAYDPKTWPVFNRRVAAALGDFGYKAPRGVGTAGRYLAYKYAMDKFVAACNSAGCEAVDALALDAFFYYWSMRLDEKAGR
jgi:HKD family nuclease